MADEGTKIIIIIIRSGLVLCGQKCALKSNMIETLNALLELYFVLFKDLKEDIKKLSSGIAFSKLDHPACQISLAIINQATDAPPSRLQDISRSQSLRIKIFCCL